MSVLGIASEDKNKIISSRFRLSPDTCFNTDQDGTAVLNVESGKFHSLIGSASELWTTLSAHPDGVTFEGIIDSLWASPDFAGASREACERSVECMLKNLIKIGLVEAESSQSVRNSVSWSSAQMARIGRRITDALVRMRWIRTAAFLELIMFQLVRRFGRFKTRQEIVKQWAIDPAQRTSSSDIAQICLAVDEAATWYPKESLCLQKASVKTCLLRQYGIPAEMKIGVHKQPFHAHAWVEVAGNVVGDHNGAQKYFKVIACW